MTDKALQLASNNQEVLEHLIKKNNDNMNNIRDNTEKIMAIFQTLNIKTNTIDPEDVQ